MSSLKEKGLTEKIAFLVHEQWSKWIKYMDTVAIHGETTVEFSKGTWHNWIVKSNYDYIHLCENDRKSDREIAKLLWEPFLVEVFTNAQKEIDCFKLLCDGAIQKLVKQREELKQKLQQLLNEFPLFWSDSEVLTKWKEKYEEELLKEGEGKTNMSEEYEWVCEKCGLVYFKDVGVCNGSYEDGVCRGKLRRQRKQKRIDECKKRGLI